MKTLTVYEANDRSRWDSPEKALERDGLLVAVAKVMAPLGEKPDLPGCAFENGHGWLQHDPAVVRSVRLALWELTREPLRWWWVDQVNVHGKTEEYIATEAHPSWICRMLDGGHDPLERAWGRICCIDGESREWGQQFYANNPDKAHDDARRLN